MNAVFVTATGTDCGKTHVSAAILRELIAQGRPALALKPMMSGYSPKRLEASDAGRLLTAMGRAVTEEAIEEICWKRFPRWAAPNVAAREAGVELDYVELVEFVRARLRGHQGAALVEGAGGVMSPLTDMHTNLDLAVDLRLPVMLLATSYLGAVSHTLTALDVLARRNLEVKVIVVAETPDMGPAEALLEELPLWTNLPVVAARIAHTPDDDRPVAVDLVRRLFH